MRKKSLIYIIGGLILIFVAVNNLLNLFQPVEYVPSVSLIEEIPILDESTQISEMGIEFKEISTVWKGENSEINFQDFPELVDFRIPDFESQLSLRFKGNYYQNIVFIPDNNLGECRDKIWRVGVIPLENGNELHFTHSGLCHWGPMMGDLFRRPIELGPLGSGGFIDSYREEHISVLDGIHPCYDAGSGWVCFEVKEVRHYTSPESEKLNDIKYLESVVSRDFDLTNRSIFIITCSSDGGIINPLWNNRLIVRLELSSFIPD